MATGRVLLAVALTAGSPLRAQVRTGIGAIIRRDRALIEPTERPHIGDSLNFDEATREEYPQANRWDYLLSIPSRLQIVGIEPHSARDEEIKVVIAKRRHAIDHLRNHLPPGRRVSKWYWVSHGAIKFSRMDRVRRILDQNGISFEGRMVKSLG